jgi:hypothetical protein
VATELEVPSSCLLRASFALHHIPLVGPVQYIQFIHTVLYAHSSSLLALSERIMWASFMFHVSS